ncbi:DnaJ domain-containing protein [Pochonia chlamydosporia 170]|uniref:DnaJ domain-containing protein n=1 Tax=Pochonia chlamydosporia 170 TaxID=1380566 RepID=A0A179EZF1_METCM|nr:DnaJ domain-containing protein [Pochonia chlamydosporia 170]OAQ58574.1 DnaJ domain-containing protein [Pochonia chlamydosporia 170]
MELLGLTIDYYAVLQISENADESTIRASYKRLALIKHPDRNKSPNATTEFQRVLNFVPILDTGWIVQEAYEVLKNPDRRKRFDAQLSCIRREAAVRNCFASNRDSSGDVKSQSPEFYEKAIYVQEQKLNDLENERAKLGRDRCAKLQEIYKHAAAIKRLQEQDEEAAMEDSKRSTWISFLTLNRYTRSEIEQRNRAATLRKTNRRDLEDILCDLETGRDHLSGKISSLNVEIFQVLLRKRELVEAQSRAQAAVRAKMEEQNKEQARKRQHAEQKLRRQREEMLQNEIIGLARKEKEVQMRRERQQQMVWEVEERFAKERYRPTRTEIQRGVSSKLDQRTKEGMSRT